MGEPPADLRLWVGGLALLALGPVVLFVLRLYFSSEAAKQAAAAKAEGDAKAKAAEALVEAQFKADIRGDLKSILALQGVHSTAIELIKKDIATLQADQGHLDKRQTQQAEAHTRAQDSMRREFEARLDKAGK